MGTKWVTEAELTAFNNAISAARGVRDNTSATQAQVDEAETTFRAAISVFNNTTKKDGTKTQTNISALTAKITEAETAKGSVIVAVTGNGAGTKTTGFTQDEFNKLKDRVTIAKTGVTVSANGDDVPPSGLWVTQDTLDTLNSALNATPSAVSDSAYLALLIELTAFNNAKQPGSMPDTASLQNAITSAADVRKDVEIAASKDEAPKGSAWVTQAQWDALDTTYTTAVAAAGNAGATKNAVAQATTALTSAITTFNAAKEANGPGTMASRLTISGLEAIYKNGTSVKIGVGDDLNSNNTVAYGEATITNGFLTVSLENETGSWEGSDSYYIIFSDMSESFISFVSKTKAAFNRGTASTMYANFELYTWSWEIGAMTLSSSTMPLDEAIGEYTHHTGYIYLKDGLKKYLTDRLDGYVNLDFLDIALYKNEACTQEFSGTDIVGPDTPVYAKFWFRLIGIWGWDGTHDETG